MANTLRFKRGLLAGLPSAAVGEPLFTTDTFDLYIGTASGTQKYQKFIASGTTSQLLRGDGSLLTMPIVLSSPANGEVLKYNGTNWVNSSDAGITGSGAAGQVAYFTGATTQGGSNNLFWDATNNRLGINNATPAQAFDLVGNALIKGSGSTSATTALLVENSAGTDMALFRNNRSLSFISDAGQLNIFSSADATNGILELDANSSASQTIFVQLTRGTVGLATSGNQTAVRINGGFSPTSGTGTWHNLHINPVINQTGGANGITRAIYIQPSLTSAADWRSVEMNNNSGWGIYQSGASAKNYFAGNTLIGSTTDNGLRFQVTGDGFFSGSVGIGTSTPLYKLDVLADTSVEPVTTPVDNYAARFRRTYTNNNASVGARRWNTYIDTTYNGNQAFTNASGLFSYVNYSNTNSSSTVNGIATYVEPTSTSAASVIRNNIAQLGLGGTITNAIGYYGYLISLTTGTTTNVKLFQADALGSTNTITNLYGFIAESTLTNATNNYGFYGNIPSGTGRWNLYMGGTAANYLNGNTGFSSTNPLTKVHIRTGSGASTFEGLRLANGSNDPNAGNRLSFYFSDNASNIAGAFIDVVKNGSDGDILFLTSAANATPTEKVRFLGNGNLGLGTSSPTNIAGYTTLAVNNATNGGNIDLMTAGTRHASWNNTATETYFGTRSNTPLAFTTNATEVARFYANGNFRIGGNAADAGFKLDVNGTMRVSGASTFNGAMTLSINQNAGTILSVSNTTSGTASAAYASFTSSNGNLQLGKRSATTNTYKILIANDSFIYNDNSGDIGILNDFATGSIKMAAGGSSTAHFTIASTGAATFSSTISSTGTNGFAIGNLSNTQRIQYGSDVATSFSFLTAANAYAGLYAGAVVLSGNLTVDTNTFFVDSSANRVGVGTASPLYALHVTGDGYFGDNVRFPNLKGCVFVQTGGSLLGSIAMDSANAVTIDNNGFAGLSVGGSYTMTGGNLGIGHSAFGTSATKTISVNSGTAPSTSPADAFQLYSADITAGNAAPHFRTENGGIIKLYQQTTGVTSATYIGGAGTTVTDLDTFDGYTIPQIVKALRNAGLLA